MYCLLEYVCCVCDPYILSLCVYTSEVISTFCAVIKMSHTPCHEFLNL